MSTYHHINYDLHRMVIFAILAGAVISALGVSITLAAKYVELGIIALNHRPDQLGDYINSPLAYIFNMGQMLAGLCMLLAMYGLQQLKLGDFSRYIAIAGFIVGLTIILMGIYPINYLKEHRLFSTGFLLATIVLYLLSLSARINNQPLCPLPLFIISLLGLLSASALTLMLNWNTLDFDTCSHTFSQPCVVAMIMWCQIHFIMLWCASFALTINKLARKSYQEFMSYQLSIGY